MRLVFIFYGYKDKINCNNVKKNLFNKRLTLKFSIITNYQLDTQILLNFSKNIFVFIKKKQPNGLF